MPKPGLKHMRQVPKSYELAYTHRVGGNRKRHQQSTNAVQKSIETVFSIPICRQCVATNGNRKHCFY